MLAKHYHELKTVCNRKKAFSLDGTFMGPLNVHVHVQMQVRVYVNLHVNMHGNAKVNGSSLYFSHPVTYFFYI